MVTGGAWLALGGTKWPNPRRKHARDVTREGLSAHSALATPISAEAIDHDAGDRVAASARTFALSLTFRRSSSWRTRRYPNVHRDARRPGERRDARSSSFNTAHLFAELIKVNLRKAAPGVARGISDRLTEIGKARAAKGAGHAWSCRHRYAVNTLALPLKTVEWQRYRSAVERGGPLFNQDAKSFLDDLLLGSSDANPSVLQPARSCWARSTGRALRHSSDVEVIGRSLRIVGPPPPALAKTGRMNAERIAVFYGAFHVQTAIAEIRPSIGTTVVTGVFKVDRPVRSEHVGARIQELGDHQHLGSEVSAQAFDASAIASPS